MRDRGVPIVFCSAKTRREQEIHRAELAICDPFIVEDGGAVFLERGYFSERPSEAVEGDDYWAIELGTPYPAIREALAEVRAETGLELRGFGDLAADEIGRLTGLDREAAVRARAREYEETVVTPLSPDEVARVEAALGKRGLRLTHGGRFHGVVGGSDKGRAVRALREAYERARGPVRAIGIGDSRNDEPFLAAVDIPLLVQRPGRRWEDLRVPGLRRVEGVGPIGWNRAILDLLS